MDVECAYLAGVLDSDGHITVQRTRKNRVAPNGHTWTPTYYTPKVGITGTRPAPHELAKALLGGSITTYQSKNLAHRLVYTWSASGPMAADALRLVLPFLRVKREQAVLAIELAELVAAQFVQVKTSQIPPYRITDEMNAERERLWVAVGRINEPRNRRVHFVAPAPSGI